ncbi:putative membrane-associated kinase regulator 6 [Sesamum alatum]|uniref:Membrane-associated kinase regulator 6 n=1 Tax=Sesamum alatum TaxID=300844 RepID=A0AAE2CDX2_9LAMI|nr:putative membrane-associated kinase regulator 6 [Sesamum alatum]
MENSQPLATESFSYSWLTDRTPHSSDGVLNNLRLDFLENCSENESNFNFDVHFTPSPTPLVHADEIFSHGHIMPVYVDRSNVVRALKTSTSVPPSPVSSSYYLESPFLANKNQYCLLGRWRKSSKRIFRKCFGFVKPLCRSIGRSRSRKCSRVDDLERKVCEIRSWSNSLEASPRPSSAYSVVDWSDVKRIGDNVDLSNGLKKAKSWRSSPRASPRISPSRSSSACDAESSIHEAILYCKRSIEK